MTWINLGQLQSRTPNDPFYSGTNSRTPHDPLYSRTNAKQRMILYNVEPMQDQLIYPEPMQEHLMILYIVEQIHEHFMIPYTVDQMQKDS